MPSGAAGLLFFICYRILFFGLVMRSRTKPQIDYRKLQTERFLHPEKYFAKTYKSIYSQNNTTVGTIQTNSLQLSSRKNTAAIVGLALGDEGKGRIVDNAIEIFLKQKNISSVAVIRFQGGNNAGHSVEKGNIKLALHLIPSGVLYKKAINIIDRGVVVHPEDLQTEMEYVQKHTGSLEKRLFLSDDAILCTDLERAEEILNRSKTSSAKGGTGRGIGPAYAHHYDKLGLKLFHLFESDWEKTLSIYYDWYKTLFKSFNLDIETIEVPDYNMTLKKGAAQTRTVGTKKEFLKRLTKARNYILKKNILTNIFSLHKEIYEKSNIAILFEGAQAAGLDAWLGTLPDVTASNTSVFGVREGTGFWRIDDIESRYGVFKIPYTSSVGSRRMPTHIDLDTNSAQKQSLTDDQKWGYWVRESAHEYGTTTGRPRDITHLDLPMLSYNARMSGVNMLIGTHLDTSRDTDSIKVCTHYVDKNGKSISYQPGLRHLTDAIPQYVSLPGWDGEICRKAKKISDLPKNALKFLSFIEQQTGYRVTAVTTGPDRKHIVYF